jgi:hypothetical protein
MARLAVAVLCRRNVSLPSLSVAFPHMHTHQSLPWSAPIPFLLPCQPQVLSQDPGMYRLFVKADDNARLWINQELLIDKWWNPTGDSYGDVQLTAGRLNDVRIEYRDRYVLGGSGRERVPCFGCSPLAVSSGMALPGPSSTSTTNSLSRSPTLFPMRRPSFAFLSTGYAHCSFWWITPTSNGSRVVVPMTALYVPRHIPGSPFDFVVKAGPAAANSSGAGSVAFGSGLVAGTAGRMLTFSVASRDKFGNDRCVCGFSTRRSPSIPGRARACEFSLLRIEAVVRLSRAPLAPVSLPPPPIVRRVVPTPG